MGSCRSWFLGLTLVLPVFFLLSCSNEPAPPKPGTPPFYWAAARENFSKGDFLKASEHLERLTKSENEFAARARPWQLVVLSGLAAGYLEIADQFELGSQNNKTNPSPLRKQMGNYRSMASRQALQFAEAFQQFQKAATEAEVTLDFSSPTGSSRLDPKLTTVSTGVMIPMGDLETAQLATLQRGVLLAACRAVGAPNDTARLADVLKSPPAKLPRDTFVLAMAQALYDISAVYSRKKLDQADQQKMFFTMALETVKKLPESKQTKELASKIEADLKKKRT
ncbi:MAG: hypothetical protein HYR60_16045 [Acidobacteria bacterium]|nr:hypothetical protein [Acidobacteriota bacterium]